MPSFRKLRKLFYSSLVLPSVSTYALSGPSSGTIGIASTNFIVTLGTGTLSGSVTITPASSLGGSITPSSLTLTNSTRSGTFTVTDLSTGTDSISCTNNGGLTNPSSVQFVVSSGGAVSNYTLSGPLSCVVGVSSSNFTVTLGSGTMSGSVTITPSSTLGGTFSPTSVALSIGSPSATFTITESTDGTDFVSTTNNTGLTNPSRLQVTSIISGSLAVINTVPADGTTGFLIPAQNIITTQYQLPSLDALPYDFSGPTLAIAGMNSLSYAINPLSTYSGTITVTTVGAGLNTSQSHTWSNSSETWNFTINALSVGTVVLTPSSNPSIGDPSPISCAIVDLGNLTLLGNSFSVTLNQSIQWPNSGMSLVLQDGSGNKAHLTWMYSEPTHTLTAWPGGWEGTYANPSLTGHAAFTYNTNSIVLSSPQTGLIGSRIVVQQQDSRIYRYTVTDGSGVNWTITPNYSGSTTASLAFDVYSPPFFKNITGSTAYTLSLIGAKDLSGNILPTYSWGFTTASDASPRIPVVVTIGPSHNATSVGINTAITVNFNAPIDSASISGANASNFVVKTYPGSVTVPCTFSYSEMLATFTAKLTPTSPLNWSSQYQVTLQNATNSNGTLAAPYIWTFTTAPNTSVIDSLPLLYSSAIEYIGSFAIPRPGTGGDATTWCFTGIGTTFGIAFRPATTGNPYGSMFITGLCLPSGGDSASFGNIGEVRIPDPSTFSTSSTFSTLPVATVLQDPLYTSPYIYGGHGLIRCVHIRPSNDGGLTDPGAADIAVIDAVPDSSKTSLQFTVSSPDYNMSGLMVCQINVPNAFTITPKHVLGTSGSPVTVTLTLTGGGLSTTTSVVFPGTSSPQNFYVTPTGMGLVPDVSGIIPGSGSGAMIAGLQVDGNTLLATIYGYYDSLNQAYANMIRFNSLDISTSAASASGIFRVGTRFNVAMYSQYMAPIPSQWQAALGGKPYLCGATDFSILGRTGCGPGAFGFDPADLSISTPAPTIDYMYHPLPYFLGYPQTYYNAPNNSGYTGIASPLFEATQILPGCAFIPDTRTLLYFSGQSTNSMVYGDNLKSNDSIRGSGYGPQAINGFYGFYVHAFDVNNLAAVYAGTYPGQPYDIQPYAVWPISFPYYGSRNTYAMSGFPDGMTFDPSSNILYLSQAGGAKTGTLPVIHAFRVRI